MTHQSLSRNTTANVFESLASIILLFGLYKVALSTIGLEGLGVWSVVFAAVSASRLADFGFSASVIKFVAESLTECRPGEAAEVVDSVAITLILIFLFLSPAIYFGISLALHKIFIDESLVAALTILPYAVVYFILTIVATVFQGALDGCSRMDLRAALSVFSQMILLLAAIPLTTYFGLKGLVLAQILQSIILCVGSRTIAKRLIPDLAYIPIYLRFSVIKRIYKYSFNVQLATMFVMALDPISKALIGKFGGAADAGYFEIATKLCTKIRGVVVNANRAVVPKIASTRRDNYNELIVLYIANFRLVAVFCFLFFVILLTSAPLLSFILFDDFETSFVFVLGFVVIAWASNIIASPAYFNNIAVGTVTQNTVGHAIMGILNLMLGVLLGFIYGGFGIVFAYSASIVVGSFVLIYVHQKKRSIGFRQIFSWEDCVCVVGGVLFLIALLFVGYPLSERAMFYGATLSLFGGLTSFVLVLGHPRIRKPLMNTIQVVRRR